MENNLDLTKILQGCDGMTFHSSVHGVANLEQVINNGNVKFITIRSGYGLSMVLDEFGRADKNGECLIWPSKTNRDWSTFRKPDPLPKAGDLCWTMSSVGNWVPRYATGELENGKPTFYVNQLDKKQKRHYTWRQWCEFEQLFVKVTIRQLMM